MSWGDAGNPFNMLLSNDPSNSLGAYSKNIGDYGTSLFNHYDAVLRLYKNNSESKPEANDTYISILLEEIDMVLNECDNLYEHINEMLITYPTYQSIYDTYFSRWTIVKNKILTYKNSITNIW
jgi:hypothetical protein